MRHGKFIFLRPYNGEHVPKVPISLVGVHRFAAGAAIENGSVCQF
jgi:hypothetical protein